MFILALFFIAAGAVAYTFRDNVIDFLLLPLAGQQLAYLTPGGGFSFIFKVIAWTGLAAAIPVAVYQLYSFVAPALPERAQKRSGFILVFSFILLVVGAAFGYYMAIPGAMNFLLTFAETYVSPMLTADSYLNFVLAYTAGLGMLFQIPLLMLIINWISPLGPTKMLKIERYVVVGAFIAAAIITPTPDVVNQVIIAAPIIVMYQVGFFAVLASAHRHKKQLRREAIQPSQVSSVVVPALSRTVVEVPEQRRTALPLQPVVATKAPNEAQAPLQPRRVFDIVSASSSASVTQAPRKMAPAIRVPIRPVAHGGSRVRSIDGISYFRPQGTQVRIV